MHTHEEPAFVLGCAGLEDVDGLQCHILEPGLVNGICLVASRAVLQVLRIFREDLECSELWIRLQVYHGNPHVTIDPFRQVADREDTKSLFLGVEGLELGIVVDKLIARSLEGLVKVGTVG